MACQAVIRRRVTRWMHYAEGMTHTAAHEPRIARVAAMVADPARSLIFAKDSQWIAFNTGHMELLSRPEVTQQVLKWLTPPQGG